MIELQIVPIKSRELCSNAHPRSNGARQFAPAPRCRGPGGLVGRRPGRPLHGRRWLALVNGASTRGTSAAGVTGHQTWISRSTTMISGRCRNTHPTSHRPALASGPAPGTRAHRHHRPRAVTQIWDTTSKGLPADPGHHRDHHPGHKQAVSRTATRDKLAQLERRPRNQGTVDLGTPTPRELPDRPTDRRNHRRSSSENSQ